MLCSTYFAFCEGKKRTFRLTSYCHVSMLIQLAFVCDRQDRGKGSAVSHATFYTNQVAFVAEGSHAQE